MITIKKPETESEINGVGIAACLLVGIVLPIFGGLCHIIPFFVPLAIASYITGGTCLLAGFIWLEGAEGKISLDPFFPEDEDEAAKANT